jgi:uncharacterized protein (TIGR00369 family)
MIKSIYDQQETVSHFREFAMNGIEQLRAFISSGKRAGMAVSLAFQLVEVGDGFAAFEGVPGLHAYNPLGTVHGGYAATLLDSACGCAVHSKLAAGDGYTTLELKIAYHKARTDWQSSGRSEGFIFWTPGRLLRREVIGQRGPFTRVRYLDASGNSESRDYTGVGR